MARSCGIRIGPRRFELVVLDGSPKKHKITAYYSGEFPTEDAIAFAEGDVSGVAAHLKEAAKTHRVPTENVSVVMSSDRAAFRHLTVPFTDKAKIDQVIKFEVESELPQLVGTSSWSHPRSTHTMESYIRPDQLSPVRHWMRTRTAEPKVWKLRCSLSSSPGIT